MFEWLLRLFGNPSADAPTPVGPSQPPVTPVATPEPPVAPVKADSHVAEPAEPESPVIVERHLVDLPAPSGTIVFADPEYAPDVVLRRIPREKISISATLQEYASGEAKVLGLAIRTGNRPLKGLRRKIGEIAVDSGRLVIADRADYESHWTDVAKERLAVLASGEESETSAPPRPWSLIPFENGTPAQLFACQTDRGSGSYKVFVEFEGDHPEGVWIDFEG